MSLMKAFRVLRGKDVPGTGEPKQRGPAWIGLSVGIIVCASAYLSLKTWLRSPAVPPPAGQSAGSGAPAGGYLPRAGEAENVARFVESFLGLYNSYRYGDYRSLTAVGSFGTEGFQNRAAERAERVAARARPGDSVNASVVPGSVQVTLTSAYQLEAAADVRVQAPSSSSTVRAVVVLVRDTAQAPWHVSSATDLTETK